MRGEKGLCPPNKKKIIVCTLVLTLPLFFLLLTTAVRLAYLGLCLCLLGVAGIGRRGQFPILH